MKTLRHGLIGVVLLAALAATGCQTRADRGFDVVVGGCATAHAHRVAAPFGPVLDVVTDHCLTTTDPVNRVAFRTWVRLPDDVRDVRIRTAGISSTPVTMSRTDLEHRYGPVPDRDGGDSLVWLLLPVGLVGCGPLLVLALRSGLVVVFVRLSR